MSVLQVVEQFEDSSYFVKSKDAGKCINTFHKQCGMKEVDCLAEVKMQTS